jgi:hypothetical protein
MASCTGSCEGILAVVVPQSRIGTRFDQDAADLCVTAPSCQNQRGPALPVPAIDGRTTPQMKDNGGGNTGSKGQPEECPQ